MTQFHEVHRRRLPNTRPAETHRVEITDRAGSIFDLYITIGFYEEVSEPEPSDSVQGIRPIERAKVTTRGLPAEIFIKVGKEGSTLRGLLDIIGIQLSYFFQHGIDPRPLLAKLAGTTFEPSGTTDNPDIPICSSIADYLARFIMGYIPEETGK